MKFLRKIFCFVIIALLMALFFTPIEKYEGEDYIIMINPITKKYWACDYEQIDNSYDLFIKRKTVGYYEKTVLKHQDDAHNSKVLITILLKEYDKSKFTIPSSKNGKYKFIKCWYAVVFNKNIKV